MQEGVGLVNRAGTALSEIVDSIKQVADIVSGIAAASAEQSTGLEQINRALIEMDEATQRNSALVEENSATAKTLEQQSQDMQTRISSFKLDAGHGHAPAAERRLKRGTEPTESKQPQRKTGAVCFSRIGAPTRVLIDCALIDCSAAPAPRAWCCPAPD